MSEIIPATPKKGKHKGVDSFVASMLFSASSRKNEQKKFAYADQMRDNTKGIPYLINFLKVAVDKAHKVGSEKDVIKVSLSHNKF